MSSKHFININNKYDRVVVLVDMDCFYCQVEEKLNPEIRGKPIAVVQYNPWQGGGIIAVNYPARAKGVTRHMRGDEAKQHCPGIVLPQVPQVRGKADVSKYRDAGKEVAAVLQTFTPLLERASVDEAYMDITERVLARLRDMNEGKFQLLPDVLSDTFAVGYESVGEFVQRISGDLEGTNSQEMVSEEDRVAYKKSDIKLLIGASIVNEIRAAVKDRTGYECSAGIAHNKILAKLTAGFHKPNKQTILPLRSIPKMYETLALKKVKGLGGKLGDQVCELLKIEFMAEMTKFSEKTLQNHFDERMGSWMFLMARGIDLEAVTPKFNSKSIGCCKRFPGKNAITGLATLQHWLGELANEIQDRLEKDMAENNRTARQMTVSYAQQIKDADVSSTRSVPLPGYDAERIASDALDAIRRNTETFLRAEGSGALHNPIKFLGISAGKFEDSNASKKSDLKEMFSNIASKATQSKPAVENVPSSDAPGATKDIKRFFAASAEPKQLLNEATPVDDKLEENIPSKSGKGTLKFLFEKSRKSIEQSVDHVVEEPLEQSEAPSDVPTEDGYLNDTLPLDEDQTCSEPVQPTVASTNDDDIEESSQKEASPTKSTTVPEYVSQLPLPEEPKPSTSNVTSDDYRLTYAEFQLPAIEPTPTAVHEPCSECGKNIPSAEMQSHLDFHLALKLSQQQREEFRQVLKSKFSSPSAAPKPKNTVPSTSSKASNSSSSVHQISKFLTAARPGSSSSLDAAEAAVCGECGRTVATGSMQEHLDYHAARRLQLELNQSEMRTVATNGFAAGSGNGASGLKRKRPAAGSDKAQPAKAKSLASYFTKM